MESVESRDESMWLWPPSFAEAEESAWGGLSWRGSWASCEARGCSAGGCGSGADSRASRVGVKTSRGAGGSKERSSRADGGSGAGGGAEGSGLNFSSGVEASSRALLLVALVAFLARGRAAVVVVRVRFLGAGPSSDLPDLEAFPPSLEASAIIK